LDGRGVVYITKKGEHRQGFTTSRTGGRTPLYCTAIGKSLLAHSRADLRSAVLSGPIERRTTSTSVAPGLPSCQLGTTIERGVVSEWEESTIGIVCVAAPVLDVADNSVHAEISVTGPVGRFRPEAHADAVRAAAAGVAATLGRRRSLRAG